MKLELPFGNFLFRKKEEFFYIFDLGGFSVKALLVGIEDKEGVPVVHAAVEEPYARGDLEGDIITSFEGVFETCQRALARLAKASSFSAKQAVIGLSGSFVYGKNFTQFYAREDPQAEIDLPELKHTLQNVQQRAYEAIRKDFATETGRSEIEVFLVNAHVQEIKIDGYRVANPLNFQGKEVSISIFNAYLSRLYLKVLRELFTKLDIIIKEFVYEPFALYQSFLQAKGQDAEVLLIDIGGASTTVSVVRKGKLEYIKTLQMGGNSFTQKIARELEVGFWEAEHIKIRYNTGQLSDAVTRKLTRMLQNESNVFLRGLELILRDFSQASLLPTAVYLSGGGSLFSIIQRLLRKKEWKEALPFLQTPKMYLIEQEMFSIRVRHKGFSYDVRWAASFSIAQFMAHEKERKDEVLAKTLKRMLKLIQE